MKPLQVSLTVAKEPYLKDQQAGAPDAARPWSSVIGNFSNVAYSQAKNPEKRASAESPASPPSRN